MEYRVQASQRCAGQREIALIGKMGVRMINGIKLGRDITFSHLRSAMMRL